MSLRAKHQSEAARMGDRPAWSIVDIYIYIYDMTYGTILLRAVV
jgi:hypothetical protein